MRTATGYVTGMMDWAQKRFRGARPGSVLILVVALLVLIALAGTAMISTARNDRYAAQQHTANTEVDMLVEGVVRLVNSALIDDLFGNETDAFGVVRSTLRPPVTEPPPVFAGPGLYEHADSAPFDPYLASRTPIAVGPNPRWLAVTGPLVTGQAFESPLAPGFQIPGRYMYMPTSLQVTYNGVTKTYPAFQTTIGGSQVFLAADTDGDGIADAGLWRMPVGQLNGITYYAAVRIIDNGSAFNASVAMSRDLAGTGGNVVPGQFFPPNVDFKSALYGPPVDRDGRMNRLDAYRFGFSTAVGQPGYPAGGPMAMPAAVMTKPVDDRDVTRPDFVFISLADQFYHQLTRRLDNPAIYQMVSPTADFPDGKQRFRALTDADSKALAYRFLYRNPNAYPASPLEQILDPSLTSPVRSNGSIRTSPYSPWEYQLWLAENFYYDPPTPPDTDVDWARPASSAGNTLKYSRRAITVTRNAVSNLTMSHDVVAEGAGSNVTETPPSDPTVTELRLLQMRTRPANSMPFSRVSINTADCDTMWRGFFETMMPKNGVGFPAGVIPFQAGQPWQMFRSTLRDPGNARKIDGKNMVLLHSASAAVNAMDYRDSEYQSGANITAREFTINQSDGVAAKVTVYGNEPQPFITEVYVSNDNSELPRPVPGDPTAPPVVSSNPKGYIAIELYNPSLQPITMTGWTLGLLDRSAAAYASGTMPLKPITGFAGFQNLTLLPNERILLENYNPTATGNDAKFQPAAVLPHLGEGGNYRRVFIANLHECIADVTPVGNSRAEGYELVLLRPERAFQAAPDALLSNMMPVDCFDFESATGVPADGIHLVLAGAMDFSEWHYVRQNTTTDRWKCVYPGRYYTQLNVPVPAFPAGNKCRHEGVETANYTLPGGVDPWVGGTAVTVIQLGGPDGASSYRNEFERGIQLNGGHAGGPNKLVFPAGVGTEPTNRFPFGGFARNGDILQVPFIGAYKMVRNGVTGDAVSEMNPITMDCQASDDNDHAAGGGPGDDRFEQVGRFCPLKYAGDKAQAATIIFDVYGWAYDLFDHFSVQNPNDDYLPNIDPRSDPIQNASRYGQYLAADANQYRAIPPAPEPVANMVSNRANEAQGEDVAPIQGLININTANWRVLASLPFTDKPERNAEIAKEIVKQRDGDMANGIAPMQFQSIFELNRVEGFQTGGLPGNTTVTLTDNPQSNPGGPGPTGDITPYPSSNDNQLSDASPDDHSAGDFEVRFLVLNRISNLITTRSDTFTVYIQVQGWRGVGGTGTPELVVQRRAAFIADRSGVTPFNKEVKTTLVPSE